MVFAKKKLDNRTVNTLTLAWFSIGVFCLIASFFIASKIVLPRGAIGLSDLDNYNTGGRMVLGAEKDFYDIDIQRTYQEEAIRERGGLMLPFRSPPIIALLFSFFARYDIHASYMLFYVFNLVVFSCSVYLIYKFLTPNNKRLLVFYPFYWSVWVNLVQGQISIVFLTIYLFVYRMFQKGEEKGAGFVSAFLILKPQLLVSLPFFFMLSKHKWRFLKHFLLGAFIIYIVSAMISEPGWVTNYIRFIIDTEGKTFGSYNTRYSTLTSFIYFVTRNRFQVLDNLVYGINFLLYGVILFVFTLRLKRLSFRRAFASSILLSLPFSVHLYNHDLIYMIIPFYLILVNVKGESSLSIKGIILAGIFLGPLIAIKNSIIVFVIIFASGLYLLFTRRFRWSA